MLSDVGCGETALKRRAQVVIRAEEAGQRVDLWLARRFTYHSRQRWQSFIRDGRVLINGAVTNRARVLRDGDQVLYQIADAPEPAVASGFTVCHQDEDVLLINKPPGLPCHPAGPYFKHTLWYELQSRFGDCSIVNRLDRETSGLTVVARNREAARSLHNQFHDRAVAKTYWVLVEGLFSRPLRLVGHLESDPNSRVQKKLTLVDKGDGPFAVTECRPLATGGGISLVEATPQHGRLHQIRASLCAAGFPVVGDKLYGVDDEMFLRFINDTLDEDDRQRLRMSHQALHAGRIRFVHPRGHVIALETSPPPAFRQLAAEKMGIEAADWAHPPKPEAFQDETLHVR